MNKRVEIIKTVQKFWNLLDQDIIKNYVNLMTGRIYLNELKSKEIIHDINYFNFFEFLINYNANILIFLSRKV